LSRRDKPAGSPALAVRDSVIQSYIGDFPIPIASHDVLRESFASAVAALAQQMASFQVFEDEVESLAVNRFRLPEPGGKVAAWLSLPADIFSARLLKLAGVKKPTAKEAEDLESFYEQHRTRQVELLTQQLKLERTLASLVEDAYGLDPEERALLRSTRPVRDPLDVLEAKIRGGEEAETADKIGAEGDG
jgi:hypothetical protein